MRRHALFAALALLVMVARSNAAEEQPRTISTTGEAVVYVVPNEVIVNFGVEHFAQDLDKAKAMNDDAGGRLIKAIKDLGVEAKHIQTDTLQVEIQYRSNRPFEGIQGYIARRMYSVTLKDTKLFDK